MAGNTKSIDVRFDLYDNEPSVNVTFADVFEFIAYVKGLSDDYLYGQVCKIEATFNFDEPYKVTFFTYSGRHVMIDELWDIAEVFYSEDEPAELEPVPDPVPAVNFYFEEEPDEVPAAEPSPVPAPDRRYQRVAQVGKCDHTEYII